jgi:hypothetical protein
MSDNTPRPRPIVVTQAVLVAIGAVISSAGFAGQIPAAAAWWIITGYLAVQGGLAFYLQSVTTPLSSPQDNRGVELVPADTTTVTLTGGEGATVVSPTAPDNLPGGGLSWTQRDPHAPVQPRPDA